MCEFIGFLTDRASSLEGLEALVTRMADPIEYRGPDDAGTSVDVQAGVALGFRRLSTIDLPQAGHQPMAPRGGSFIIAFNGEAYNHLELRAELLATGATIPPASGPL